MSSVAAIQWPVNLATAVNIAAIVVPAVIAAGSLYWAAGSRQSSPQVPQSNDTIGLLMTGLKDAWPIYWLVGFLIFINADFAWSALITTVATVQFLPAALGAAIKPQTVRPKANVVPATFLLLAAVMLLASGIGIDREFSRLDGHFILTMFLLYLWWGWYDRTRRSRSEDLPTSRPMGGERSGLGRFAVAACVVIYHLSVPALLLATITLAQRLNLSAGILFGLILAACWVPASVRKLLDCQACGDMILARSLAIIYIAGIATLVSYTGTVTFPFTLWQMEIVLIVLAAVFWLAKALTDQPLGSMERLFLLLLYLTYLTLRITRMILAG